MASSYGVCVAKYFAHPVNDTYSPLYWLYATASSEGVTATLRLKRGAGHDEMTR